MAAGAHIELQGVHFAYPSRPDVMVLRGVDIVVKPRQVVALCGPSGSGKSTVFAMLQRLYDPVAANTTGSIAPGTEKVSLLKLLKAPSKYLPPPLFPPIVTVPQLHNTCVWT